MAVLKETCTDIKTPELGQHQANAKDCDATTDDDMSERLESLVSGSREAADGAASRIVA